MLEPEFVAGWKFCCKSVPVSVFISMSVCCVCLSQRAFLCLYWTTQKVSHEEGMRDSLQKFFTEIYKAVGHWFQLIPADPENKQHYRMAWIKRSKCVKHLWIMLNALIEDINLSSLLSASVFVAFRKWLLVETCITLGQEHGRVNNIRL